MKEIFYGIVLVAGIALGWFVKSMFIDDDDGEKKTYISISNAVKESKFSFVRDDFSETFFLCEDGSFLVGDWKALVLTAYDFHYGVDAKNLELIPENGNEEQATKFKVNVKSIETISPRLKAMKVFTLERTIIRNEDKLISNSKDQLVARADKLATYRIEADPEKKIQTLLKEAIRETIQNLSVGLGRKIEISDVVLPRATSTVKAADLKVKYQCGEAVPDFGSGLFTMNVSESVKINLPVADWEAEKEDSTKDGVDVEIIELPASKKAESAK